MNPRRYELRAVHLQAQQWAQLEAIGDRVGRLLGGAPVAATAESYAAAVLRMALRDPEELAAALVETYFKTEAKP